MSYRFIQTNDGGKTLWDPHYNQAYKSTHAAQIETEVVFCRPAVLEHPLLIDKPDSPIHIRILELGFGLGSNFLTTVKLLAEKKNVSWEYVGVDASVEALEYLLTQESIPLLKTLLSKRELQVDQGKAKLILSSFPEALESLAKQGEIFQSIYFDPFSPKVNPEAWQPQIFSLCAKILSSPGRLATYSVSREAKDGLLAAGFQIQKLVPPPILQKKSTLLAIK
jgi:chorismate dehydratase